MVFENGKYKCEKKENKRKVGVLMNEEQNRNVMEELRTESIEMWRW